LDHPLHPPDSKVGFAGSRLRKKRSFAVLVRDIRTSVAMVAMPVIVVVVVVAAAAAAAAAVVVVVVVVAAATATTVMVVAQRGILGGEKNGGRVETGN